MLSIKSYLLNPSNSLTICSPVSIQINLVLIKRIFSGKDLKSLGDSRRIVLGVVID